MVRLAEAAHVGVTVDVGTGLFVPVVRNAGRRSLADIADTLLRSVPRRWRTASTMPTSPG